MPITSVYPVLICRDVTAAADFFRDGFGFDTTFETDWYVSLRLADHELALVAHDHETVPEAHRAPSRGVIINVETDDVDAVHARLIATGHEVVSPLRDEEFGQRHVIFAGPDCLVDVIQPIAPSADFLAAYANQ